MRIILSTFGSFGDVHPYMAIALELKRRGHVPVIATSEMYRAKIEAEGLEFFPVRPDLPPPEEAQELIEKVMAGPKGPQFLLEQIIVPALHDSYEDLLNATRNADLFVSHLLPMTAPMVAEKTGISWISTVLAPIAFFSAYDVSVPPVSAPLFPLVKNLPARLLKALFTIGRSNTENWVEPVYQLREQLGLARGGHPLFEGQHSPQKVLALFSPLLGAPQPDWPPNTVQTGFCIYDKRGRVPGASEESFETLPPDLEAFLHQGEAPIVFTLGSSAVFDAGTYFEESARAAQMLGRRAVLLIGGEVNQPRQLPHGVAAFDYAPFSQIFPRSCAVVHQGGVGTTAQAMRAGKPMLVMPFSHDQPDHAYRMKKLGIGLSIKRQNYRAEIVAQKLKWLLQNPSFAQRAAQVGTAIRAENGVARACDEIEALKARL